MSVVVVIVCQLSLFAVVVCSVACCLSSVVVICRWLLFVCLLLLFSVCDLLFSFVVFGLFVICGFLVLLMAMIMKMTTHCFVDKARRRCMKVEIKTEANCCGKYDYEEQKKVEKMRSKKLLKNMRIKKRLTKIRRKK